MLRNWLRRWLGVEDWGQEVLLRDLGRRVDELERQERHASERAVALERRILNVEITDVGRMPVEMPSATDNGTKVRPVNPHLGGA